MSDDPGSVELNPLRYFADPRNLLKLNMNPLGVFTDWVNDSLDGVSLGLPNMPELAMGGPIPDVKVPARAHPSVMPGVGCARCAALVKSNPRHVHPGPRHGCRTCHG